MKKIVLLLCFLLIGFAFELKAQDATADDIKAANNFDTKGFDFDIANGPFKPIKQSFIDNYQCPEWFRDAKFGIYMHWGLNTVAGFDGHYGRFLYMQHEPEAAKIDRETKRNPSMSGYKPGKEMVYQYHVQHFGHPTKFGYKDFIPLWKADKFNADSLAAFFKDCGAKYIGVMAVHHDNFDLYNSTYQPWNAYRMGPKIDIVGAWEKACKKEHLRFAITSHLSNGFHEHLFYQGETDATGPLAGVPYDTKDPKNDGLYGKRTPDRLRRLNPEFAQNWYHRTKELIDKYNPDLLYLDGGLPNGAYGLNLAAHFYNHNIKAKGKLDGVFAIKDKSRGGFTLDVELAGVKDIQPNPWQVDNTINPGWFYLGKSITSELPKTKKTDDAGMSVGTLTENGDDPVRLTADQIIDNLADIVSKNGNMMLNVGLKPDGSLSETYRKELVSIGQWLKTNGEAIYNTRPFTVFGEGPFKLPETGNFNDNQYHYTAEDIRFTQSKDGKIVYAILLDWPGNGKEIAIKSLGKKGLVSLKNVTLLATHESLKYSQDEEGLHILMPNKAVGEYAFVLMITGANQ